MTRVMGVDGCTKGWVGITNDGHAYFGESIAKMVDLADLDGLVDVVAIDIPIGLPESSAREADRAVRGELGKRRSSIFATPIRAALEAATHAEASLINREVTGSGISKQAFALKTKIFDVEAWVRATDRTVIEVHPELSFKTVTDRVLDHPKSSWAGAQERWGLLRQAGVNIPDDMGVAGEKAAVDDVLDAAIASWSALRYARKQAVPYPDLPNGSGGPPLLSTIWA